MAENQPVPAVIGGGSWATAIVNIITRNGFRVNWWMRDAEHIAYINDKGHNPAYLRHLRLETSRINFFEGLNEAIAASDHLFVSVPSAFLADAFSIVTEAELRQKAIISVVKGLIRNPCCSVTEYFHRHFAVPHDKLAIFAGPSHAEEVAAEMNTFLAAGAASPALSQQIIDWTNNSYIQVSGTRDITGIEYAGVLKNIYAIAAGMAQGLGEGDNFKAVLIASCAREMKNFFDKVLHQTPDVYEPQYLGDLLVTAYSQYSRNRTFGNMIGKGYTVQSARLEMNMVAEGYYAAEGIRKISQREKIFLPLADVVFRILYEDEDPSALISVLKAEAFKD